mmetsp:Transcript_17194/g.49741  ORF Transcript_17194/g.49741 Transcript_17194/m.49741 type:complete len:93 (+) Transcript_17194:541-819(+)
MRCSVDVGTAPCARDATYAASPGVIRRRRSGMPTETQAATSDRAMLQPAAVRFAAVERRGSVEGGVTRLCVFQQAGRSGCERGAFASSSRLA